MLVQGQAVFLAELLEVEQLLQLAREAEALAWAEATVGDVADETR